MRAICSLALLFMFSACAQNMQSNLDPPVPTSEEKSANAEGEIRTVSATEMDEIYQVKFETSKGEFILEVDPALAPIGAARFRELVEAKFFDGCRFFRTLSGFVTQFGINGNPEVHSKWEDKNLMDEPVKTSNKRGTITFAKTSRPNTRSTQLFINYGDNSNLDSMGFSPFGRVVKGMNIVDSFFSGYGESPDQMSLEKQGNSYLNKNFPKLDYIKTARIIKQDE